MMSFIKSRSLLYLALILLTGLIACDKESEKEVLEPKFESFTLRPEFNSGLNEVVVGDRSGIEIKLTVPYNVSLNNLVVSFNYVGVKVEVNGVEQISNVTANDFSQPVTYTVFELIVNWRIHSYDNENFTAAARYVDVKVVRSTGIMKKETYKKIESRTDNLYIQVPQNYCHRRNERQRKFTWHGFQKPYRIKLDEKARC